MSSKVRRSTPTEYEVTLLQARLGISYEEAEGRLKDKGPGGNNYPQPEELSYWLHHSNDPLEDEKEDGE